MMASAKDLDAVPRALLAEQTALEAEYAQIKDLSGDDPRVVAYADRFLAHGIQVVEFAERVRLKRNAPTN